MSHAAAPEAAITAAPAKDNLLGICHAIGEDFGFNPFLLRVSLAVAIIFAPAWTLAAYGMMGVAVLASRLLIRRKPAGKIVALREDMPAVAPEPTPETTKELALAA